MYKVGDRVVVKNKDGIIDTFDYYMKGIPNWTQSRAYMIMFAPDMFRMCGQSGVVYEEIGHYGEEVKIMFDDETLPIVWTWHKDWLTPQMIDNRSV